MIAVTSTGPPDPGRARSLDELVEGLRDLKRWAGDVSFATITRRINERWQADGRPAAELARRGTVVDCFKPGRRRINDELILAVVQALHDDSGYVAHWRQALRVSLAETAAAAQVRVLPHLPDDVAEFTGRPASIARLRHAAEPGGPAVVCVLTGMAGVGKTQLAVHAGHLLAGGFDLTLFVNLRGFDPDPAQPPADPGAVLDGFLRLLGVSGHEIPHDVPARSALLRETLAGRTALIVLDNAADEEQVAPLLPGGSGTLTLVTSRRRLGGLPSIGIEVGVLTPAEAERMLVRAAPGVAVGQDPAAYERIARRCGHLPLALSLAAGQLAAKPGWSATDHADRLDERHRHGRLDAGVELALHVSYLHLPVARRMLLRRLALHPGPDLDHEAAAALLGTDAGTAAAHLRQLTAESLVQQPVRHRFTLHDLVRAFAVERARDEDRPADRTAALGRLSDHYVYGAAAAMDALHPAESHRRPAIPPRGGGTPGFADAKAALQWLESERMTLVAVCRHDDGRPDRTVQLAGTIYSFLDNGGYSVDAVAVHTAARAAARRLDDRPAEATALTNLGVAYWQLSRYADAIGHFERARALFGAAGDRRGEARALGNLGVVHTAAGRPEMSPGYHRQALERFVLLEDRLGEANTLANLASALVLLGRAGTAVGHNRRALEIFRELRHRGGEATALNNLGDTEVALGRFDGAVGHYEQALALFRELGERYGETCVLNGLGHAATGLGRQEEAVARHRAALALATEIGN